MPPTPPVPPDDRDCEGSEDDTKIAALSALQQMDDARARPILQKVLAKRDAGSACLRRKAVFLIAQQDLAGNEDILLEPRATIPTTRCGSRRCSGCPRWVPSGR